MYGIKYKEARGRVAKHVPGLERKLKSLSVTTLMRRMPLIIILSGYTIHVICAVRIRRR